MAVLTGPALQAYIVQGARQRNLDPAAVLAVASVEGGWYQAVGDGGTSFGPFQLHVGGALPGGISDPLSWANSPEGLDYALDHIAGVAAGLSGTEAVSNIVYRFERPADPASEVTRAMGAYPGFAAGVGTGDGGGGGGGGGTNGGTDNPPVDRPDIGSNENVDFLGIGGAFHDVTGFFGDAGSWIGKQATGVAGAIYDIGKAFARFVSFFINPLNWLRMAEFVVGLGMIGFGIALFLKGSTKGATQAVTNTTGAAASLPVDTTKRIGRGAGKALAVAKRSPVK